MLLSETVFFELEELFLEVQNTNAHKDFLFALQRFLNYLEQQVFFTSIINTYSETINNEAEKTALDELKGNQMLVHESNYRPIIAYHIIKNINQKNIQLIDVNYIKQAYLIHFWNKIKRSFTTHENILYWLLRYKKRTEEYDSEKVLADLNIFRKGKTKNLRIEEQFFAPRINKYLFDNGIEIISEPKIRGRRVDVFGKLPIKCGNSNFLLEYKVLLKSQGNKKEYLKKAFYQTYLYGKEYQKNIVYLIVFVIGEGDVKLNIDKYSLGDDLELPCYEFDNIKIVAIKVILKSSKLQGEIDKNNLIAFFDEESVKQKIKK